MDNSITNFNSFNLPKELLDNIKHLNYTTPTSIQAKAIPVVMKNKDLLASAQTGTGKTAAFSIPVIADLLSNPNSSALILAPTRELALQIVDAAKKLIGRNNSIRTALLIGGASMGEQLKQLRSSPRFIVGTPGRVNDHFERRTLKLKNLKTLVLDEVDIMLDMGFDIQLEQIIRNLPKVRQTLMFSATLPKNIMNLAKKYLHNPETIAVEPAQKTVTKIDQKVIYTSMPEKYNHLVNELSNKDDATIVFVNTKAYAEKLYIKLRDQNFLVEAIHGDLRQHKRDRIIRAFRNKKYNILIATNVAARGLDIPHLKCVINYDLPQCSEDYIHRIGRTGRAGAAGNAISLVAPQEKGKWNAIKKLAKIS
jgi:superfamily II DNA/RNA helicase